MVPFFLWMYIKSKDLGKNSLILVISMSLALAVLIGGIIGVSASPPTSGGITNVNEFSQYYIKPYIRLPPYFFGVLVGLWYREYKQKYGIAYKVGSFCRGPIAKYVVQGAGWALMFTIVFMIRPVQGDPDAW